MLIPPTSCWVSGVGIAVLQLSRPLRHQWWGRGVLRVWQWVAQHHRLPHVSTLNTSLLLPLPGHVALQLLGWRDRYLHILHIFRSLAVTNLPSVINTCLFHSSIMFGSTFFFCCVLSLILLYRSLLCTHVKCVNTTQANIICEKRKGLIAV